MSVNFFKTQIQKIPGKKNFTSNRVMILCPFHNETKPSGAISLDSSKPKFLGRFYCWGRCKRSASWNEIAEKFGLQKINGQRAIPDHVPEINLAGAKSELFADDDNEKNDAGELSDYTFFELEKWPHNEWRGFKKEFIEKLGARLAYHDETERFYIWFPVKVNKERVGWFRALTKPVDGIPSYLNKKGSWVKTKGLFPFDVALKIMHRKELKTMVLVEGQRDALRLIRAGIPAVCIMGTNNWTDDKKHILEMAGVERLILCMDGDLPGKIATFGGKSKDGKRIKGIYETVTMHFDVKVVKLWRLARKMEVEKIDPYEAPVILLHKLRKMLI